MKTDHFIQKSMNDDVFLNTFFINVKGGFEILCCLLINNK